MKKRLYLGVFLTAMSVLMLEIALTRIFSVILFYHFAFLVVSLALLGIGLSGFYVYLFPKTFRKEKAESHLTLSALFFSFSIVLLIALISFLDLENVYPLIALSLIPFFFGGLCLALILNHFSEKINKLYFFDLLGSGIGCLAVIGLLNTINASSVMLTIAIFAALSAWIFFTTLSTQTKKIKKMILWTMACLFILTVFNSLSPIIPVDYAKDFLESQIQDQIEYDKWNAFSRIIVYSRENNKDIKKIIIDSSAATTMTRFEGNLNELGLLTKKITSLPYELGHYNKTLIIGPGGGQDILTALVYGNTDVTGVEINPIIVNDVVKGVYRDFTGDIYNYPGVKVYVDEGRSFLERNEQKYDLIQNTFVDTWAATSAGAYALSENNLYTVEAFKTFLNRLEDDGILSVTRWWTEQPRESLRVVSVALEAYKEIGISDASNNIIIIGKRDFDGPGNHVATLMFKKSTFTEEEISKLENRAQELAYETVYSPRNNNNPIFAELIHTDNREEFYKNYVFDVRPVTDNRPFFFYNHKFKDWFKDMGDTSGMFEVHAGSNYLYLIFLILIGLIVILILLPLILSRKTELFSVSRKAGRILLYFVFIGLGFLTVEIFLMHKLVLFLGHPIYSLSVVLFSLLVFGGIGSYLSGRFKTESIASRLKVILLILVALLIMYIFILPPIIDLFLKSTQLIRIFITVLVLLPLGILMGMPFPLGINLANRTHHNLIPWIWGLNGGASVLGSVLAFILSINFGFIQTLVVGAAFYLLSLSVVKRGQDLISSESPNNSHSQ